MPRHATEIDDGAAPDRRPTDPRPAGTHGWWAWVSGGLLLLVVVLLATHVAEERALAQLLREAHPGWLLAAACLQLLTYVCAAAVWQRALVHRGVAAPLAPLVPLGFAKLFTDQALPSAGMSGTLLVVRGLERRGTRRTDAVSAVVTGLVAYQLGYLVVTLSAVAIVWRRGELGLLALVPATVVCLLALAFPWLVVVLLRVSRRGSTKWFARWPGARDAAMALGTTDPRSLFAPRLLIETVACQLAIFALDALTLAATLLLRGFTFWLPMLPGFVLARRELEGRPQRA
jgi:uncharacterized membrane protein YbhN (UPF0104 family)